MSLSLTSLCFSFLPSNLPISPPPLSCAPCRLKYASIIVWEIGSRGLGRKVCLGWACYVVSSPCWRPARERFMLCVKSMKVNWNYQFETIIPWREMTQMRSWVSKRWGWSRTLRGGKWISGLCQKLPRNDLMNIWFAVVSLHVQTPGLVQSNP